MPAASWHLFNYQVEGQDGSEERRVVEYYVLDDMSGDIIRANKEMIREPIHIFLQILLKDKIRAGGAKELFSGSFSLISRRYSYPS